MNDFFKPRKKKAKVTAPAEDTAPAEPAAPPAAPAPEPEPEEEDIAALVAMGFDRGAVAATLAAHNGDVEAAANALSAEPDAPLPAAAPSKKPAAAKKKPIASIFAPKKRAAKPDVVVVVDDDYDEAEEEADDEADEADEAEAPPPKRARKSAPGDEDDDDDDDVEDEDQAAAPARPRRASSRLADVARRKPTYDEEPEWSGNDSSDEDVEELRRKRRKPKKRVAAIFAKRKTKEEWRAENEALAKVAAAKKREDDARRSKALRKVETEAFGGGAANPFFEKRATGKTVNVTSKHAPTAERLEAPFAPCEPRAGSALSDARADELCAAVLARPAASFKNDDAFVAAPCLRLTLPRSHCSDTLQALARKARAHPVPPRTESVLSGDACVAARRGLVEWLRTKWGAAGRASVSDGDDYFDSDEEAEEAGAALIAGPLGCGKTRVAREAAEQAGFSILTMELDASAPVNELQKKYKEATSSRRLKGARQLVLVDDIDRSIVNDPQRVSALRNLVKNARCPVVATCTVSRDAGGQQCSLLATKLGCPRYFQLPFCADVEVETLLAARAAGDAWAGVRAHIAALADGDARKALVLLEAALLDDGNGATAEATEAAPPPEPWCPATEPPPPEIQSVEPFLIVRRGGRVRVRVARCDGGYALINGRRLALDGVVHVDGLLQAFVDVPAARPAQRYAALVVVRGDGARADSVAYDALVEYEAEEVEDEAPRGRLRRHAAAASDDEDAVLESPSAKICDVAEVSPENAPSPHKKPRRRVVVDEEDEDSAPADAADPLPVVTLVEAAPTEAEPMPSGAELAPMEAEPAAPPAPAPMEAEPPTASSAPWAPPRRARPRGAPGDAAALAAAAALAEARSAVDTFRRRSVDGESLLDDDDTLSARRDVVLRFATAAPRPSTGADRMASSLGVDLLVATPTPPIIRERHRDARYAGRCAVADGLVPPRLDPEPALDYAPSLRAIFGGEKAREATFAGRRFTHYLRDARHTPSALAFAYECEDLACPTN